MSNKYKNSYGEVNSDDLKSGICVIPLVLQFYKKPKSSLGVYVEKSNSDKVDKMMKRSFKNNTLVAQSSSREIRKKTKISGERSKSSIRSNVKKMEIKGSTKSLPKTVEKESRKSKESARTVSVSSEGNYDVKLEVCSTKFFNFSEEDFPDSEDYEASNKERDYSETSLDKITQPVTSNCVLNESRKNTSTISIDIVSDEEDLREPENSSSLQIEFSGNSLIVSKNKSLPNDLSKTENASLKWVSGLYESEMLNLHEKLDAIKNHIKETKCPSMKCRRKLDTLTNQVMKDQANKIEFILNREKISSMTNNFFKYQT